MQGRPKGRNMYWNAPFRTAFQAMLMRFGDMFTLTSGEYALNDEANRIDQLIVKNTDGIADDIIAEFFLPFNIMEFKSPRDRLGIREYHRAEAYAHLLIAYGCSLNAQYRDVGDLDVTITFVHDNPPHRNRPLLPLINKPQNPLINSVYHIRQVLSE